MDRYGIQVNKTSRNTVLFMTNIGTTRSSVAYLIEVLVRLAEELEDRSSAWAPSTTAAEAPCQLADQPHRPLPDFSAFHGASGATPDGADPARATCGGLLHGLRRQPLRVPDPDEVWRPRVEGRQVVSATSSPRTRRGSPCWCPDRCSAGTSSRSWTRDVTSAVTFAAASPPGTLRSA